MPSVPLGTPRTFQPFLAAVKLSSLVFAPTTNIFLARIKLNSKSLPLSFINYQILPSAKKYFNNGIAQDTSNIYISKSSLPEFAPAIINSLESIIAAQFLYRIQTIGRDANSRIQYEIAGQWVEDGYSYTAVNEIFYHKLTVVDDEITDYFEGGINPNKI